jgi:hypothetical protein
VCNATEVDVPGKTREKQRAQRCSKAVEHDPVSEVSKRDGENSEECVGQPKREGAFAEQRKGGGGPIKRAGGCAACHITHRANAARAYDASRFDTKGRLVAMKAGWDVSQQH